MISTAVGSDESEIHSIADAIKIFNDEEKACVRELWREYIRFGPEASGYNFLVHRDNGRILGFACYGPHALTNGTYDLYWIAVNPLFSRRGVGSGLLGRVEAEIRRIGGRMIVVETSQLEEYTPARAFYAAHGYTQEAVVKGFYRAGDDLVIFTKQV